MNLLLVALIALIGPLLLSALNNHHQTRARNQEWQRQDRQAADLIDAAAKVAAKTEEVAVKAEEVKTLLAESTATTDAKLNQIHTLVNSNLTASMQGELDATRRDLASLREVARLNIAAGEEPSDEARAVIAEAQARVDTLKAEVTDRLAETRTAEETKQAATE